MKTYLKLLVRGVKSTRARFISILAIVAIGTGFLAGLLATTPDMQNTMDAYYDRHLFFDANVRGTLGMTEADAAAIEALDFVQQVMPAYVADLNMTGESGSWVTRIYGVPLHDRESGGLINDFELIEGRLPVSETECLVAETDGSVDSSRIGSVFTISDDNRDYEDIGEDYAFESLTVVGVARSPYYISAESEPSAVGTGTVGLVMFVLPEAFKLDVYTDVFVRFEGLDGLNCFHDEYSERVEALAEQLEELGPERSVIRYSEVIFEAYSAIGEARKALDDANEELELAQEDIADGWQEIKDGERELQDAQQEIEDGWRQLDDARRQLEDGWREYDDGVFQLGLGRRELERQRAELESALLSLDEAEAETAAGARELEAGKQQIPAAKEEIAAGLAELRENEALLEESGALIAQNEAGLAAGREQISAGYAELELAEEQLKQSVSEGNAELEAGWREVQRGWAEASANLEQLNETRKQLAFYQSLGMDMSAQIAEVDAGIDMIFAGFAELEAAEAGLRSGEDSLASGKISGEAEIAAGYERLRVSEIELEIAQAQLDDARAELESGRKQIEDGYAQLRLAEAEIAANEAAIAENEAALALGLAEIAENRLLLEDGLLQLEAGELEIAASEEELAAAYEELLEGEKEAVLGEKDLRLAEKELRRGLDELEDGREGLYDAQELLADGEEDIAEAEEDLAEAEDELLEIEEPEWFVTDREDTVAYLRYSGDSAKVEAVAKVFPIFFFLVAALVALTTMTRMVEEERTQMGTLKALGYSNASILGYYVTYSTVASLIGSLGGMFIGFHTLPVVIANCFSMLYTTPRTETEFMWEFASWIGPLAVVCTTVATLGACLSQLRERPATLMLQRAPKAGKRILLEYLRPVWRHMTFTQKVAARNIFRYRKRFYMTVIGISGCCALLVAGFGLRDSIRDIEKKQFGEIDLYNLSVYMKDDSDPDEDEILSDFLENSGYVSSSAQIHSDSGSVSVGAVEEETGIYVPEEPRKLSQMFTLRTMATGEIIDFDESSCVLTQKTSEILGVQPGDSVTLENGDEESAEFTVTGVCENYVSSIVFVGRDVYEEAFGSGNDTGLVLVRLNADGLAAQDEVSQKILESEDILLLQFTSDAQESFGSTVGSIDYIIIVLIIAAGLLAYIVLYNLTNINICERKKELATVRVLGFSDGEVAAYIYRETTILCLIGILVGLCLGDVLHRFIIQTIEVDAVMFGREVYAPSYLFAALITLLFTALVDVVMLKKLADINMVESLKANE